MPLKNPLRAICAALECYPSQKFLKKSFLLLHLRYISYFLIVKWNYLVDYGSMLIKIDSIKWSKRHDINFHS